MLGQAGADPGHRPKAVVGRDPRASGEFLSAAVVAGLASAGVDVYNAGVLPTPAVAYLTADTGADFGVMLSASHNAMPDNGIKFFARGGHKLRRRDRGRDRGADAARPGSARPAPTSGGSDRCPTATPATSRTCSRCCPTGSTGSRSSSTAPTAPRARSHPRCSGSPGRRVARSAREPDGLNINDGYGSTHLDQLKAAVVAHGADLGIAHDGDADRCLAVDATGTEVDGDQIMAILAVAMRSAGCWPRTPSWPP